MRFEKYTGGPGIHFKELQVSELLVGGCDRDKYGKPYYQAIYRSVTTYDTISVSLIPYYSIYSIIQSIEDLKEISVTYSH